MNRLVKPLKFAFHELVTHRREQIPFWIMVGFVPTFIAARLTVQHSPTLFLNIRGIHIHHFIYGMMILSIIGFVALVNDRGRRVQAFIYGIGLALAFDEFGMWLNLTANYDVETSEIAMAWILALLVFSVYGVGITRRAWTQFKRLNPRRNIRG